jgi:hypothetical protein
LHAVNDIFIGQCSHVSTRYSVSIRGRDEQQSSSGIIVSIGLGQTGWLKSIYAGWAAVTRSLSRRDEDNIADGSFPWDAEYLHYFVREPYPGRTTEANIVIGQIAHPREMTATSQMAGGGVIFSDGLESDYLEFNSGTRATIELVERRGLLVV